MGLTISPHSHIPVTNIPEYPPWDFDCKETKMAALEDVLRGEKLNYKSVSKDAERRMIRQRFPAELYAGRGRASNMAGKSNL